MNLTETFYNILEILKKALKIKGKIIFVLITIVQFKNWTLRTTISSHFSDIDLQ